MIVYLNVSWMDYVKAVHLCMVIILTYWSQVTHYMLIGEAGGSSPVRGIQDSPASVRHSPRKTRVGEDTCASCL